MKNLLVETNYEKFEIVEDKSTKDYTVIRGRVGKVDTKNRNGRIYPREIMEREISKLLSESSQSHRLGAIDHPTTGESITDLAIKYDDLQIVGNDIIGEMRIIPTAKGRDLETLVRAGIEVGMSSRGLGESKFGRWKDGTEALIVNSDYDLRTFDAVVNPSVAEARAANLENHYQVLEKLDSILESDPDIITKILEQLEESEAISNKKQSVVEELTNKNITEKEFNSLPSSVKLDLCYAMLE